MPRRRGTGDAMPTQIRFLGPDLPEGLILPIDSTSINIGELKERALSNWPAGVQEDAFLQSASPTLSPPCSPRAAPTSRRQGDTPGGTIEDNLQREGNGK